MLYCFQNKLYPREVDRNARGRIRVQLKNDDGTPVLPHFPTRQYVVMLPASGASRVAHFTYLMYSWCFPRINTWLLFTWPDD